MKTGCFPISMLRPPSRDSDLICTWVVSTWSHRVKDHWSNIVMALLLWLEITKWRCQIDFYQMQLNNSMVWCALVYSWDIRYKINELGWFSFLWVSWLHDFPTTSTSMLGIILCDLNEKITRNNTFLWHNSLQSGELKRDQSFPKDTNVSKQ